MKQNFAYVLATTSLISLAGCSTDKAKLIDYTPLGGVRSEGVSDAAKADVSGLSDVAIPSLAAMIGTASAKVDVDAGFEKAMRNALISDPYVIQARNEVLAQKANLRMTTSGKDFNFDATVLGGVVDVSSNQSGVATILTAKRMLFDGGRTDSRIAADAFAVKSAEYALRATQNERAVKLAHAWIELERYRQLNQLIDDRLEVLEPLLEQLEQVVTSGMGDASQVAAAQRTVSLIRVTQTDVSERYENAKINFLNLFGNLPKKALYDWKQISKSVPAETSSKLAENAPALLAQYESYMAAEAGVAAVKALNSVNVGFETKIQKPMGDSRYDADESIGLVLTKTFFKGDQLKSQIDNAEAKAAAQADRVRSTFREGELQLLSARQMIVSMNKAIELSRSNAEIARNEIDYLRKQLIIGGSTLDAVLSAEARLYEAESKEIGFTADRRKSEVTILGLTGGLAKLLKL